MHVTTLVPRTILILLLSTFLTLPIKSSAQASQTGSPFRDCTQCPEMVAIPAGTFMMGSSTVDTERDLAAVPHSNNILDTLLWFWPSEIGFAKKAMPKEHPQHTVTIARQFGLGKYPVTTKEFAAFIRDTGYSTAPCIIWSRPRASHSAGAAWSSPGFSQTDRDPIVCVSWNDANAYISWLNRKIRGNSSSVAGGPYRLPTEAEWEYAARAGTQTARWWGDGIGVANAKCDGCGGPDRRRQTVPVGSFPANPFGLYDMLGNVWQWTEDCWTENYSGAPSDGSAWKDTHCTMINFRGGSWNSTPWVLRSTSRSGGEPSTATNDQGFRVAKTLR